MRALTTERLILRALTADDTQKIFDNWASDPEVPKYMEWNAHENVEVTRHVVDMWLDDYKNENCYRYVIVRKEDGEVMGMIDVVKYIDGVPVVGYCSGKRFWGNGYMTEALKALLEELFGDGYEAVIIYAVNENIGSNRVIQKAGFRFVGAEQRPHSEIKPEIVTINNYRLEKDEWQRIKESAGRE